MVPKTYYHFFGSCFFKNPTFCLFGLGGFLVLLLFFLDILLAISSHCLISAFNEIMCSSFSATIRSRSSIILSLCVDMLWEVFFDSGASEELTSHSGVTSRNFPKARRLSLEGWFIPERYLLITEAPISVPLTTSTALQCLSNIAWRNLSAKLDTAFVVSLGKLYAIILILGTIVILKLYHLEANK